MKKSKILLFLLCLLGLIGLTGCGNKTAITDEHFRSIAEENELSIIDATGQFPDSKILVTASIAKNDNWQVEFYVIKDTESAVKMFNTNKKSFQDTIGHASSEVNIDLANYSEYTLTGDRYMHVSRIDNTVVYVNEDKSCKGDIEAFLKKIGY